jgi:hypothetical protein
MRVVLVAMVVALVWLPAIAAAQPVVLESYTGKRPESATALLAPLHDELAARGYLSGDSLGRRYEARESRPAASVEGLPPDFESGVERGHKAWVSGRFDEAISTLVGLVSAAHANPTAIAQNQSLRDKLLKGLIALALSQQRKGDLAAVKATFSEILRSYPDTQIPRGIYGPEAYQLFEDVRRSLGQGGRGRLTVKVTDPSAVVFLNERFENVGSISKSDMLPGAYRVFIQVAKQASRTHTADVKPDEEAVLAIDPIYDVTLRTRPWTGFVFADAKSRDRDEPRYAARFASEVGASAVVVVGIDQIRGRPALYGSIIDRQTARELRRASIVLEPTPSVELIKGLAAFLGGEAAPEGLIVEVAGPQGVSVDNGHSGTASRSWMLWTGIGGAVVGAAAGGGLAIKFAFDARDAKDELDRACAVSCTSEQAHALESKQTSANRNAVIAGVAGGAIVATGVVFIVLSRLGKNSRNSVAVVPTSGGVYASWALSF